MGINPKLGVKKSHFSRTRRFEGLKDSETLGKETLKPNARVLKAFAQLHMKP